MNGENPFFEACLHGDLETVKSFLEKGEDPEDYKYFGGWSALTYACTHGHLPIVKLLLEYKPSLGLNINFQDTQGWTPLMRACSKNNVEIISFLLEKGANIEAKSFRGETPLIAACAYDNLEVSILLLEKGARTEVGGNWNPLRYACHNKNKELAKKLLLFGAKRYNQDLDNFSALKNRKMKKELEDYCEGLNYQIKPAKSK